jgi:peptidoglycan pentaglycine glycine transferase (the first glycine)
VLSGRDSALGGADLSIETGGGEGAVSIGSTGTVWGDGLRLPLRDGDDAGGGPSPAAWDAFVDSQSGPSYLQLGAWARAKEANGWSAVRIADDAGDPIGAQVLMLRAGPLPWAFAYAPRGPVLGRWDAASVARATELLRDGLRGHPARVSHLRIDPEIEMDAADGAGPAVVEWLRACGWSPADALQPNASRLVDLRADEDALWGDLRPKWRQYVNRARGQGVRIVESGGERLDDFYRIYRETARRAGFIIRSPGAYREVWNAFAAEGRARLLFAELPGGEPVATLLLLRAGRRVVEPYGGMTAVGGESRANYLLKWEAIRTSREQGAETYDMWGLSHEGIAHFKAGFGGREVRYIGAWDLVLDPIGWRSYGVAHRASVGLARLRHGIRGETGGRRRPGSASPSGPA